MIGKKKDKPEDRIKEILRKAARNEELTSEEFELYVQEVEKNN